MLFVSGKWACVKAVKPPDIVVVPSHQLNGRVSHLLCAQGQIVLFETFVERGCIEIVCLAKLGHPSPDWGFLFAFF